MSDQPSEIVDPFEQVLSGMAKALPGVDLTAVAISVRIGRLASIFNRAVEDLVRPHGFGYGELEVLFFLLNGGKPAGMRPSDLMKGCFVTSGAITGRVDRLTKLGLVQRIPSLIDRREMTVRLTRNGEKLSQRLQVKVACESALTVALAEMGGDRGSALNTLLNDLHMTFDVVVDQLEESVKTAKQ